MLCGIISAALFYGDAVITPALSVLSAIEGLKIATPAFDAYVVPLTVIILIVLFAVQSHGTARVAAFFGPITAVWFIAIAVAGRCLYRPQSGGAAGLQSDLRRRASCSSHGVIGLITLGAVFLAVTGAEALYADLGHFGRKPIQIAWVALVLPSLALNYLGQGALVLADPKAIENPFFLMYPDWALLPMVVLATAATVIASQAVITGAYSITQQAIQLGLMPRLEIRHTSGEHYGQIYMPRVNMLLLVGVLLLVLMFRSSSALASAYGIAVTGTMVVTGIMAFVVIWKVWRWSPFAAAALMLPFLADRPHLPRRQPAQGRRGRLGAAGARRRADGDDVHVAARQPPACSRRRAGRRRPLVDLVRMLERKPPARVPGTAVFLTSDPSSAPTALLHSLKHYKVLHEKNVILTIETADTPRVNLGRARADRAGRRDLHPHRAALRLHGVAERAEGAGGRAHARLHLRHHVDVVLPVRGACSSRRRVRACRAGRTGCSSCSPGSPTTPPTTSRFRPGGSSRSARR